MADLDGVGAQITPSTTGYIFPLVVYYTSDGGATKSSLTLLNAYGAKIETSLKASNQATISDYDKNVIVAKVEASTVLAKETTLAAKASQTSVNAIPTNPLLTSDTRLDNLDAAVSSRLATSGYTAPDNTAITAIKAKTDTLVNAPTLAEIESSTVLAKEGSVKTVIALTA